MTEEIIHLRKESRESLEKLEDKLDENILATKALEKVMQGGFDNIGKVLQEISNKLD